MAINRLPVGGASGGSGSINVIAQPTEPDDKTCIWVKTDKTVNYVLGSSDTSPSSLSGGVLILSIINYEYPSDSYDSIPVYVFNLKNNKKVQMSIFKATFYYNGSKLSVQSYYYNGNVWQAIPY